MLKELLREYDLPNFPEGNVREECLKLMQKYEFGHMPKPPKTLHWEVVDASDKHFAGGKTLPTTVRLYGELENGREYEFPVRVCIPAEANGKTGARVPFFVHLNFRPNVPDKYQPTEEIIDNGFAVLSFCYTEVTSDDGDFTNGSGRSLFSGWEKRRWGSNWKACYVGLGGHAGHGFCKSSLRGTVGLCPCSGDGTFQIGKDGPFSRSL